MVRSVLVGSILVFLCSPFARAERQVPPAVPAQTAAPQFQVATIKPSQPDEVLRIQIAGRRFSTTGTTVVDILKYAYGVHVQQIAGGPAWLATEKFDILADPDSETRPASNDMKKMVQQLLADRLHLAVHREKRELPVYAIVVAKSGAKLTPSTADPNGIPTSAPVRSGLFSAGNATMTDFAAFMQRYVMDRPVVDQTGIQGRYDLHLQFTPDQSQSAGGAQPPQSGDAPSLYTAMQEQLGLRLEAMKAPVDVLVIDHVEQPSAN